MNSLSSLSNIRLLALKTLLVYLELAGVLQPAYSYYAEYKYKLLVPEKDLLARFKDERYYFVEAILHSSDKARSWATLNFDSLYAFYPSERSRVISALNYLDQQGLIELQSKQMTQVYNLFKEALNSDLREQLVVRFKEKEVSEIARIHFLLDFFASRNCLNLQLANYFSDNNLQQPCGHCSVCAGQVALMPAPPVLRPLADYEFASLSMQISDKLADQKTSVLLARFFCGLTTPVFTRLKVRNLKGFSLLEGYRFKEVKEWIDGHIYR